jgi:hypothetical protein
MAVLVVAALFWGNCLSCPQMLLARNSHGCCKRSQKSGIPTKDCQQHLHQFVKSDDAGQQQVSPVVAVAAPLAAPEALVAVEASTPAEIVYSPPPKFLLDSSLRI